MSSEYICDPCGVAVLLSERSDDEKCPECGGALRFRFNY